jgi:hypothetical protein
MRAVRRSSAMRLPPAPPARVPTRLVALGGWAGRRRFIYQCFSRGSQAVYHRVDRAMGSIFPPNSSGLPVADLGLRLKRKAVFDAAENLKRQIKELKQAATTFGLWDEIAHSLGLKLERDHERKKRKRGRRKRSNIRKKKPPVAGKRI